MRCSPAYHRKASHYYPAFPYTSYTRMTDQDIADLFAFLKTLPQAMSHPCPTDRLPVQHPAVAGRVEIPVLLRPPRVTLGGPDTELARGQYLVEGPGHCGECHTPRNLIGGFVSDAMAVGRPEP
jgi:mono/diheme cytochrome c family protein